MRRSRRRGLVKERILMVASAVLVLGSLTATGLWLGRDRSTQDEGYVVDLSAIENNTTAGLNEEDDVHLAESVTQGASTQDDLDYDPYFQETNSQKVENPDQSESESMSDGTGQESADSEKKEQDTKDQGTEKQEEAKLASTDQEENTTALSTAMQPALTFSDSDTLVWPIVGNILVNYSMDKTVYFPTLQQYKYNPAIIIQANEGDLITAASAGSQLCIYRSSNWKCNHHGVRRRLRGYLRTARKYPCI